MTSLECVEAAVISCTPYEEGTLALKLEESVMANTAQVEELLNRQISTAVSVLQPKIWSVTLIDQPFLEKL